MPKAKLEFNLPEESEEFQTAIQAGSLHAALWEMATEIRKIEKYSDKKNISIEAVGSKFYEILNDRDIHLF